MLLHCDNKEQNRNEIEVLIYPIKHACITMLVLADHVFTFWLVTSNFWYLFAFFEAIHSAITWLITSSRTTLRAVFMIPECSWEQRSSDMLCVGPVVCSMSLDLERVFSPDLQVSTTDFKMKGLNLLSAWVICKLVTLVHKFHKLATYACTEGGNKTV